MGNPITRNLPGSLDDGLACLAQATGKVSYADIMAFGEAWPSMLPEKKAAAMSLMERIRTAANDGTLDPDESPGGTMDLINALAEIVKP